MTDNRAILAFQAGNKNALGPLLKKYRPFLHARASAAKRKTKEIDYDDLFQAASLGFLEACRRFEPERGFQIATYAEHCIKTEIGNLIRGKFAANTKSNISMRIIANLGKECHKRGWDRSNLTEAQRHILAHTFRCDPARIADTAALLSAPADLESIKPPSIEGAQTASVAESHAKKWLTIALVSLPERERMIIENCVIREPKVTLERMGLCVGLTAERVRQLRDQGIIRMRTVLESRGLNFDDFF